MLTGVKHRDFPGGHPSQYYGFLVSSFFFVVDSCLNVSVDCDYGCEDFTHPWEGREALGEGHKLGLTLQLRKEILFYFTS